jgi:hypothetical protein
MQGARDGLGACDAAVSRRRRGARRGAWCTPRLAVYSIKLRDAKFPTSTFIAHSFMVCSCLATIFWLGHLTHAGLPVTAGVRHVFVASFDLRVPKRKK